MPKEKEEIVIEKATLVAYCSLRKLHVTPFVKDNGRVAFRVKGNVSKTLAELQTNPSINVLDYIQRLEAVRSIIFTMKEGGHE
ncbi:MAG: hypothetical protein AB1306_07650 [Nitrospirota bacterium]